MEPSEAQLTPVLRTCDAVGRLMEFWGFSRHLGRVWTLLYLSRGPQPAADIQAALSISAGAASTYLRELLRWGVARKVWVPGERKDYFEAETDLWRMVSRVIEEREGKLLSEVHRDLEEAAAQLEKAGRRGTKADREQSAFRKERVEGLTRMVGLAESLLRSLVENQMIDVSGLDQDLAE